MAGYDPIFNDMAGTGFQSTPLLDQWTETITLQGVYEDGSTDFSSTFMLVDVNDTDANVVHVGDAHYKYPHTYCISTTMSPQTQDSTTSVRQFITYQRPGKFSVQQYDTYQQTEIKNFDVNNKLTLIAYYNSQLLGYTNQVVPFVADIRLPSILRSVRITQYEELTDDDASPVVISDAERPFWNLDDYMGYPAGTLLFVGVQTIGDGTPIYRRTYTFLYNSVTPWHHFFAVYVDRRGLKPQDIKPINPNEVTPDQDTVLSNGAAAFKMLDGQNFSEYFSQIKPPFNQGRKGRS